MGRSTLKKPGVLLLRVEAVLHAGGIEPQTDGLRESDENNARGYFEWEAIKQVCASPKILDEEGIDTCATKLISMLLPSLSARHQYKVIS